MCFVIHKNFKDKQVATEDIVVYKRLNDDLSSYRGYKYEVGKVNPIVKFDISKNNIEVGYHSWAAPGIGYYKFIIPKGSEYYYSLNQSIQYVSTQIMLVSDEPLTQEECIEICNFPTSYIDACEKNGLIPLNEDKLLELGLDEGDIAIKKLTTIIQSINHQYGVTEYDWDNALQHKWFCWFSMDSPGFRFDFPNCRGVDVVAGCSSRLHLPFEFAVQYVCDINEEFKGYWKTYMLV